MLGRRKQGEVGVLSFNFAKGRFEEREIVSYHQHLTEEHIETGGKRNLDKR